MPDAVLYASDQRYMPDELGGAATYLSIVIVAMNVFKNSIFFLLFAKVMYPPDIWKEHA